MQKIIDIDSQVLSSIQKCSKKTELHFIKNIQTKEKSAPLEKGELIHIPLEIYYGLVGNCVNLNSKTWIDLIKDGLLDSITSRDLAKDPDNTILDELQSKGKSAYIDFAINCARYFATKMSIDTEDCQNVIYQFGEYCDHYQYEELHPLAVEEVGTKIMYEDDDIKILYTFKIDLVAEMGNKIFPVDHKSSSRRQDPTSMSNQFFGYCWGLDQNDIIINTIGFQKTLSRKERFQRYTLGIDKDRINEWRRNAIYWILDWQKKLDTGFFPMNYTGCKGNFVCEYLKLCEANPLGRDWVEERDFMIGEKWEPASKLDESLVKKVEDNI